MRFNKASTDRACIAFVLAGGKSVRMGTDKAFLDFHGETLLHRALAVARSVCDTIAIVGDPAKFSTYASGPREAVVADIFPGCGPLSGIHAALMHSSAELNLMLAVDMPFVSSELLSFLFAAAGASTALITVPRAGGRLQPLCAVYRRGFASASEEALRAGKYKIEDAFPTVSTRVITDDELAAAGFSERNFFNLNTPADRQSAEAGGSHTSA
jgi:molybdopterin-guanine dinucleotide biosynthesis protein A